MTKARWFGTLWLMGWAMLPAVANAATFVRQGQPFRMDAFEVEYQVNTDASRELAEGNVAYRWQQDFEQQLRNPPNAADPCTSRQTANVSPTGGLPAFAGGTARRELLGSSSRAVIQLWAPQKTGTFWSMWALADVVAERKLGLCGGKNYLQSDSKATAMTDVQYLVTNTSTSTPAALHWTAWGNYDIVKKGNVVVSASCMVRGTLQPANSPTTGLPNVTASSTSAGRWFFAYRDVVSVVPPSGKVSLRLTCKHSAESDGRRNDINFFGSVTARSPAAVYISTTQTPLPAP